MQNCRKCSSSEKNLMTRKKKFARQSRSCRIKKSKLFSSKLKKIKTEKLDINSESVLTIVDALKNNQQLLGDEKISEENDEEEILPEEKIAKNFISEIA